GGAVKSNDSNARPTGPEAVRCKTRRCPDSSIATSQGRGALPVPSSAAAIFWFRFMGRSSQRTDRMIRAVKRQKGWPSIDTRLDMHRSRPEAVQVPQCVLGVVELQVDPEMVMVQVKLTSVPVVAVLDPNDRLAEVGQSEQQAFLDLLELAALDFVGLVLVVVLEAEELMAAAEVGRQEGIHERHV